MKNLKLELFNFRKNLSLDQEEVSTIVEGHMNACNEHSEKSIINSLNEKLKVYTYDKTVKSLLESLNDDMSNHELLYELKSLYNASTFPFHPVFCYSCHQSKLTTTILLF